MFAHSTYVKLKRGGGGGPFGKKIKLRKRIFQFTRPFMFVQCRVTMG